MKRTGATPTEASRDAAVLDAMHAMGDAPADAVIASLIGSGGVPQANAALSHMIRNMDGPSEGAPPILNAFLNDWAALPAWADMDKVRRAQTLFTSQGPCFGLVLMASSLPVLYCGGKGGAQVLYGTGQLSGNFRRRASQTLRFILDVMEPGGLEPMGKGIRAIQKVRLMHAAIRHYSRTGPLWVGKEIEWGAPINQVELAGTLIAFSSLALDGLRKLEIDVSPDDQECYLHAWKAIGHVLGIHADLLPRDMRDAHGLWKQIKERNFIATKEGRALAADHIDFLRGLIPGKSLDGFPDSLMYFLMGRKVARKILKLPRPGWTYFLIAFLRWIMGLEGRMVLRSSTLRRLTSEAGSLLMESLYKSWNQGDGSPFRIPQSMTNPA
jgi:hypothetical protein